MTKDKVNLLEHLLRKGTTPSFSFPLDVCEFRVDGLDGYTNPKTWAKMGQDLRKGLIEYSPGRELVVNGVRYVVGGLCFFNPPNKIHQARHVFGKGLNSPDLKWYNRCVEHRCGWVSKEMDGPLELESCPVCEGKLEPGRWYRPEGFAPIIVPYTTNEEPAKGARKWRGREYLMKAADPKSMKTESARGRIELPAPLLGEELDQDLKTENIAHIIGLEDISRRLSIHSSMTDLEDTNKGIELILINSGYNNRGYFLCPDCGRTEIKDARKFRDGPNRSGHHRPYAPWWPLNLDIEEAEKQEARELCTGMPLGIETDNDMIMLGMTFKTDIVLFRFEKPKTFIEGRELSKLRSFDGGIRAIKEALIEEVQVKKEFINREIGGGIRKFSVRSENESTRFFSDIFLYDEVSGGAGLTTEIVSDLKEIPEILDAVETRLSGKLCIDERGCDMACIGCLLDFRNSQEHNQLDRKNGLRLLRYIMYGRIPTIEQGEVNHDGNQTELQNMARSISIDSGFNVELESADGGFVLIVRSEQNEMKIRPISEMVNLDDDPVVSHYGPRQRKELNLEGAAHEPARSDRIYWLHIERFSRLRTKLARLLREMLLPLEDQPL